MADGITVRFLGDFGPFSRMGKSIGYQITVGNSRFLLDCGAPLFQQIGGHGLKEIKGLILTHCHDDHKRWFTDLSLFSLYAPDVAQRIFFMTSEDVHAELVTAACPSLDRSLSPDAKCVIDIPFADYIDYRIIGPRARYRIAVCSEKNSREGFSVIDSNGDTVGPEQAKVIISQKTGRPRMLFRDPELREWVEPESFYDFSSDVFYEKEKNRYVDPEGFTIEALKAPVWHGISAMGIVVKTTQETLVFTSDTNHNKELWEQLAREKRPQLLGMAQGAFAAASVIHGDINDYIERTWSEQRYREAVRAFQDGIVIHDVSSRNSVVHTDYDKLSKTVLRREKVILTHSPDRITSAWTLGDTEKTFKIQRGEFFEVVGSDLCRMDADIYHRESGRYFVGYRNECGSHSICEKNGLLALTAGDIPQGSRMLFRVDLYEDIGGKYYPALKDGHARYVKRPDGKVEVHAFTRDGSSGCVVEPVQRSLA
jgi:hypothetical protein